MNRLHIATLPFVALLLFADSAWPAPTVITFEELSTSPIPDGYFGFNWENMWTFNGSIDAPNSGYVNGTVSGVRTAFNGTLNGTEAPAAALTVSGDPFNFVGAYFTAAWNNGLSITIEGYLDGSLEYTSTVEVDTTGPTFVPLNYSNVDELRFSSFGGVNAGLGGGGEHYAMDDFTFTAIPEPSAGLLCMSGLGCISWLARASRRSAVR